MNEHAIDVENVSIYYRILNSTSVRGSVWEKKQRNLVHEAVRNLSFSVDRGEVLGIVGKNGSGLSIKSPSSEKSMISCTLSSTSFSEKPSSIPDNTMFSLPDKRLINPIPSAIRETVFPCRSILPALGEKMPAIERSSVDFPLPFFPTIPSTSPLSTEKERFLFQTGLCDYRYVGD